MPSYYNPIPRTQVTLLRKDRNWGEKGSQLCLPAVSAIAIVKAELISIPTRVVDMGAEIKEVTMID